MTVKVYLEGRKNADKKIASGLYLGGVGTGFDWANFLIKKRGQMPLYCVPSALPLSGPVYVNMVDRQIEFLRSRMSKADLEKESAPLLLLKALIEAFPCAAPEK